MCNPHLTFSAVDARFPGSANDTYVLGSSELSVVGEEGGFDGYFLLGDSGLVMNPFFGFIYNLIVQSWFDTTVDTNGTMKEFRNTEIYKMEIIFL